jgi:hypothetical protein
MSMKINIFGLNSNATAGTDILIETQLSKFLKILQIPYGYHKLTSGFRPMSNLLTEKEVNYESI